MLRQLFMYFCKLQYFAESWKQLMLSFTRQMFTYMIMVAYFFVVNRYSRVFYTRLQSEFVFKWLTAYYCRLGRGGYLFLRFYATNEFLTSTQTGSKFQWQHEMSQKRLGKDDESSFQRRRIVTWVTWQHDVTIKTGYQMNIGNI